MARTGKIARLSHHLRSQLNSRLDHGDQAKQILPWLNSLPEVKLLLHARFNGRPITEQNLSDWRLGGYEEWLARREWLALADDRAANLQDLEAELQGASLTGHLTATLLFRYASILAQEGRELDEKSLRQLRALLPISQVVVKLRRGSQDAARLMVQTQPSDPSRLQPNPQSPVRDS